MNKSEFIEVLAQRFDGNKAEAKKALEVVLDTITREVAKGEKVAITGFGAFEKAVRPARMVRNPATGERVRAKKTSVPKFRAGAELKAVVSGAKKLPKLQAASKSTAAKKTTAKAAPAKKSAAKKSSATKSAAKKTAAKKSTAKKAPAKKAPAKKAPAKKAPAKKTTTAAAKKTAAKKSTAKKAPAKKTAAKKAPAKKAPAKKGAAKKTAKKS